MARAPKFDQPTQQEADLAKEFLKDSMAAMVGTKLEADPSSPWLINPVSKATYNVYLLPPADTMTGMVKIILSGTGDPQFGKLGANWLVLFDPRASKVWLLPWIEFGNWVKAMHINPQHEHAMMRVRLEPGSVHINMHPEWAVGVKLVKAVHQFKKGEYLAWREKKLVTKEQFVHLHNHSTYSLLDGASSVDGLAVQAVLNGQPGIALTDHGYMFGSYKHWENCKERGIKPIMGVEAYVVDDVSKRYIGPDGSERRFEFHQTIIATNQKGWENLCILMTLAGRDHFWYRPRIDHKLLYKYNEGLIVLSGCFKGMVAHYLQTRQPKENEVLPWWLERNPDKAREHMRQYKEVFGDRYYCEVMNIDYAPYMQIIPELLQMAAEEQVPTVVTVDSHYEKEEDAILQAVLSRMSNQRVDGLGDSMQQKGCYYIRPKAEVQAGAPWVTDEMCARTCQIMERCDLSFEKKGQLFPPFDLRADADWQAFEESRKKLVPPKQMEHPPAARNGDPITSKDADKKSKSQKVIDRAKVVELVWKYPGITGGELDLHDPNGKGAYHKRTLEAEREGTIHQGPLRKCSTSTMTVQTYWPGPGPHPALLLAGAA